MRKRGLIMFNIVIMVLSLLGCSKAAVSVNTKFAEKIVLEVESYTYADENRESFTIEIIKDDATELKKIFNGTARKDTPSCPCDGVKLIFSSSDKSLILYPAGDDCDTVRIVHDDQDYYFHLGDKNNKVMREILTKYGVIWPYGI